MSEAPEKPDRGARKCETCLHWGGDIKQHDAYGWCRRYRTHEVCDDWCWEWTPDMSKVE